MRPSNATDHGVLQRPDGRVELSWWLEGEQLRFRWRERGDSPDTQSVDGFGLRLFRLCVERGLNGTAGIVPSRQGWTISWSIPLASDLGVSVTVPEEA